MKSCQFILIVLSVLIISSCGTFHSGKVLNLNNNQTQVELNKKNFKVVGKTSGSATASYILGIGISKKALIENAKSAMYDNAGLVGTSRAIINISIEKKIQLAYIFYTKTTIVVSGYVVEFTE